MQRFRSAVIGTGFIGPVHVEGLRRAGVEVAAIIGSTSQKSRDAAARLGINAEHLTLDDVLLDPSIDAIHVTTPNRLHYPQAVAVLQAGKHVMCEKPLAMNSSETKTLVEIASQCNLAAGVAYNIRFYPLCHEAAAQVSNGTLGDLLHVQGSYVQDWLLYDTDFNWRVVAADGGDLRAVADIGTHWLDLVQFITGCSVTSVCADLRTVYPKRKRPTKATETFAGESSPPSPTETVDITTEDCGCVMLRFDTKANGCLWVSQTTAGRKNCLRFELAGSHSSISWNSEQPNSIWIGHRDRPNESLIRDPALMHPSAASISNYPGGHNEGFPDTFKQLFHQFYDYIRTGDFATTPPFPSFRDGHREVLLCEAILRSHRERRWVDVHELET